MLFVDGMVNGRIKWVIKNYFGNWLFDFLEFMFRIFLKI